jgi:hypothetical protein
LLKTAHLRCYLLFQLLDLRFVSSVSRIRLLGESGRRVVVLKALDKRQKKGMTYPAPPI